MTGERLSIQAVNQLDREVFIARFGGVYEHSPWVAEGAWARRPFADRGALERAMQAVVSDAGQARQLDLLRQHPALGTRKELTGYSRVEQAGAGILAAAEAERSELAGLNQQYETRFGFPFILAVRGATLSTILDSCRTRLNHDFDTEFAESLRQVFRIAGFRLGDLIAEGK
jgi:2-oxo-4-hydroxy-4-carboxy-5-ureidoimidazoline decarboxylase